MKTIRNLKKLSFLIAIIGVLTMVGTFSIIQNKLLSSPSYNSLDVASIEYVSSSEDYDIYHVVYTDGSYSTFELESLGNEDSNVKDIKVREDGHLVIEFQDGSALDLGNYKGDKGNDGEDGVSITSVFINMEGKLVITYSNGDITTLDKVVGERGADGVGIQSITKSNTEGLVDTYDIAMTDGSHHSFTVTNGEDGVSINNCQIVSGELIITLSNNDEINLGNVIGAEGARGEDGVSITSVSINEEGKLVITYSNGDITTLGKVIGEKGEDGVGVESITKTNTDGLVDTYDIAMSDGSHHSFTVTNGEDGVSINNCQIVSGELIITLSNTNEINLGNIIGAEGISGEDGVGIDSITLTNTVSNVKTYTISYTNGSSTMIDITDGVDGAKWLTFNGVPTFIESQKEGDFCLNTITSKVYQLIDGIWTLTADIKGTSIENVEIDYIQDAKGSMFHRYTITLSDETTKVIDLYNEKIVYDIKEKEYVVTVTNDPDQIPEIDLVVTYTNGNFEYVRLTEEMIVNIQSVHFSTKGTYKVMVKYIDEISYITVRCADNNNVKALETSYLSDEIIFNYFNGFQYGKNVGDIKFNLYLDDYASSFKVVNLNSYEVTFKGFTYNGMYYSNETNRYTCYDAVWDQFNNEYIGINDIVYCDFECFGITRTIKVIRLDNEGIKQVKVKNVRFVGAPVDIGLYMSTIYYGSSNVNTNYSLLEFDVIYKGEEYTFLRKVDLSTQDMYTYVGDNLYTIDGVHIENINSFVEYYGSEAILNSKADGKSRSFDLEVTLVPGVTTKRYFIDNAVEVMFVGTIGGAHVYNPAPTITKAYFNKKSILAGSSIDDLMVTIELSNGAKIHMPAKDAGFNNSSFSYTNNPSFNEYDHTWTPSKYYLSIYYDKFGQYYNYNIPFNVVRPADFVYNEWDWVKRKAVVNLVDDGHKTTRSKDIVPNFEVDIDFIVYFNEYEYLMHTERVTIAKNMILNLGVLDFTKPGLKLIKFEYENLICEVMINFYDVDNNIKDAIISDNITYLEMNKGDNLLEELKALLSGKEIEVFLHETMNDYGDRIISLDDEKVESIFDLSDFDPSYVGVQNIMMSIDYDQYHFEKPFMVIVKDTSEGDLVHVVDKLYVDEVTYSDTHLVDIITESNHLYLVLDNGAKLNLGEVLSSSADTNITDNFDSLLLNKRINSISRMTDNRYCLVYNDYSNLFIDLTLGIDPLSRGMDSRELLYIETHEVKGEGFIMYIFFYTDGSREVYSVTDNDLENPVDVVTALSFNQMLYNDNVFILYKYNGVNSRTLYDVTTFGAERVIEAKVVYEDRIIKTKTVKGDRNIKNIDYNYNVIEENSDSIIIKVFNVKNRDYDALEKLLTYEERVPLRDETYRYAFSDYYIIDKNTNTIELYDYIGYNDYDLSDYNNLFFDHENNITYKLRLYDNGLAIMYYIMESYIGKYGFDVEELTEGVLIPYKQFGYELEVFNVHLVKVSNTEYMLVPGYYGDRYTITNPEMVSLTGANPTMVVFANDELYVIDDEFEVNTYYQLDSFNIYKSYITNRYGDTRVYVDGEDYYYLIDEESNTTTIVYKYPELEPLNGEYTFLGEPYFYIYDYITYSNSKPVKAVFDHSNTGKVYGYKQIYNEETYMWEYDDEIVDLNYEIIINFNFDTYTYQDQNNYRNLTIDNEAKTITTSDNWGLPYGPVSNNDDLPGPLKGYTGLIGGNKQSFNVGGVEFYTEMNSTLEYGLIYAYSNIGDMYFEYDYVTNTYTYIKVEGEEVDAFISDDAFQYLQDENPDIEFTIHYANLLLDEIQGIGIFTYSVTVYSQDYGEELETAKRLFRFRRVGDMIVADELEFISDNDYFVFDGERYLLNIGPVERRYDYYETRVYCMPSGLCEIDDGKLSINPISQEMKDGVIFFYSNPVESLVQILQAVGPNLKDNIDSLINNENYYTELIKANGLLDSEDYTYTILIDNNTNKGILLFDASIEGAGFVGYTLERIDEDHYVMFKDGGFIILDRIDGNLFGFRK